MSLTYNGIILIWALCHLPSVLFRKKYRGEILARLGFKLPTVKSSKIGEMRIWIHAVSLGETKAIIPFIDEIRANLPDAKIYFSNVTNTGHEEAVKLGGKIERAFYLPIDTSWAMRRLVERIQPDLCVLVEGDYWYHMLKYLKLHKVKIAALNARISLQSYKKFRIFSMIAKRIFSKIDLYCVQSEEFEARFKDLGVSPSKIHVTGNMKFDVKRMLSPKVDLNFPETKHIITIASTHEDEESLILDALKNTNDSVCLLIAPRHPERFQAVADLLKAKGVKYRYVSDEGTGEERVVLVNKMGVLDQCYEISTAAIMGGSFVKGIGGHNIYEPTLFGIPVIYGPYMHNQEALVRSFKRHKVGVQVELGELANTIESYVDKKGALGDYQRLKCEMEGATIRCWELVKNL